MANIEMLDRFVFKLLASSGLSIDPEVRRAATNALEDRLNDDRLYTDVSIAESEILGPGCAAWLHVLHFENNLQSALSAAGELRQGALAMAEISQRISETASGSPIDPNRAIASLVDAFASRTLDLLEYLASVRIGGKVVFGFQPNESGIDFEHVTLASVFRVLNGYLRRFYKETRLSRRMIIPISLRWAERLSWTGNEFGSTWVSGNHNQINRSIDLSLAQLGLAEEHRVLRVGISIADVYSQNRSITGENEVAIQYHAELKRPDGLYEPYLGDGFAVEAEPIYWPGVVSSNQGEITWADSRAIRNTRGDGEWSLTVSRPHGQARYPSAIRDLVLYFEVMK